MKKKWILCFIGLGGNVGDRGRNLRRAERLLRAEPGVRAVKASSVYETSPIGPRQRSFFNRVLRIETELAPLELLDRLQEIERALGRKRARHWGPRTIDLDLLLYGRRRIRSAHLTVPHRELRKRRFVLVPLAELDPGLRPPGSTKTVSQLSEELTDPAQKVRLRR